jgi:hypothetical protein
MTFYNSPNKFNREVKVCFSIFKLMMGDIFQEKSAKMESASMACMEESFVIHHVNAIFKLHTSLLSELKHYLLIITNNIFTLPFWEKVYFFHNVQFSLIF